MIVLLCVESLALRGVYRIVRLYALPDNPLKANVARVRNELTMLNTKEMKISIPSTLSQEETKLLLAVKLYEVGRVSLGQAANLAGFSKRAFMEILGRHQVPVFNYSADELREEIGL